MLSCELVDVLSDDDIGHYEQWLWGEPEHYQHLLAIISKYALPVN
ncbi:hypothetical protein J2125_000026 [Erwinia toletana]|uniref:Uncharacterized protein n=1 Tax=Winslowiella toletana TaxID=92490 RepID=A0ABS4P2F3_9GAMM|nr:hypothetical protein [Winslowiella toletana]MBP2166834.1 hypothetical protein [Winslowiella toletana]